MKPPLCKGHSEPCVIRQVKKAGPNQGAKSLPTSVILQVLGSGVRKLPVMAHARQHASDGSLRRASAEVLCGLSMVLSILQCLLCQNHSGRPRGRCALRRQSQCCCPCRARVLCVQPQCGKAAGGALRLLPVGGRPADARGQGSGIWKERDPEGLLELIGCSLVGSCNAESYLCAEHAGLLFLLELQPRLMVLTS